MVRNTIYYISMQKLWEEWLLLFLTITGRSQGQATAAQCKDGFFFTKPAMYLFF